MSDGITDAIEHALNRCRDGPRDFEIELRAAAQATRTTRLRRETEIVARLTQRVHQTRGLARDIQAGRYPTRSHRTGRNVPCTRGESTREARPWRRGELAQWGERVIATGYCTGRRLHDCGCAITTGGRPRERAQGSEWIVRWSAS